MDDNFIARLLDVEVGRTVFGAYVFEKDGELFFGYEPYEIPLPRYSTGDWKFVVDKVNLHGYTVETRRGPDSKLWRVCINRSYAHDESQRRAICKAAIKNGGKPKAVALHNIV